VLSTKITPELPESSILYGPDGNASQSPTLKHRESNTEMAEAFARSLLAGHGVSGGDYEIISNVKRGEPLVVNLSLGQPTNIHAQALETRLVRVMGGDVAGLENGTYQGLYTPTVISAPAGSIGSAENLFLTPLDPFASVGHNVDGTSVSIEIDLGTPAETPLVFHFAYQNLYPRVPTEYSVSVDGAIVGTATLGIIRFQPGFVTLTTTNTVVGKRRLITTYSDQALMATTGSICMYQILVASEGYPVPSLPWFQSTNQWNVEITSFPDLITNYFNPYHLFDQSILRTEWCAIRKQSSNLTFCLQYRLQPW
jgi:hypothetical protein